MKKNKGLFLVLVALLAVTCLLVSCNSEVTSKAEAGEGKLVYATFGNGSKATRPTVSSMTQSYSVDGIDDVYWVYTATKDDAYGTHGQQTSYVRVNETKGLAGAIGPFSKGYWNFSLKGYKYVGSGDDTTTATTDLSGSDYRLVFVGSVSHFLLSDDNTASTATPISVTVYLQTDGGAGTLTVSNNFKFFWADKDAVDANENLTLKVYLDEDTEAMSFTANLVGQVEGSGASYYKLDGDTTKSKNYAAGDHTLHARVVKSIDANTDLVFFEGSLPVKIYSGQITEVDMSLLEGMFVYGQFDGTVDLSSVVVATKTTETFTTPEATASFTVNYSPASNGTAETGSNAKNTTVVFSNADNEYASVKTGTTNTSYELGVTVSNVEAVQSNSKFTVDSDSNAFAAIDLTLTKTETVENDETVSNVDTFDGGQIATVTTYIAMGLTDVKVYYNNSLLTPVTEAPTALSTDDPGRYTYDPVSGKLIIYTAHFSNFAVGAAQNVYDRSNNTAYKLDENGTFVDKNETYVEADKNHEYVLLDSSKANNVADEIDVFNSNFNWSVVHDANDIKSDGFAGGYGTKVEPYLISCASEFSSINNVTTDSYFMIKDKNSTINLDNWAPVVLYGSFNGNGATLNIDNCLFRTVSATGKSVIKDFTINSDISVSDGIGAVLNRCYALDILLKGITVHGTIIGASWVTPFIQMGPGAAYTWFVSFEDCFSDATLVATSGSASGFIGHPYNVVSQGDLSGLSMITITDSAFVGNISATGGVTGANFKYFTINGNNNRVRTKYTEKFTTSLGYNPEGTLYNTPADATGYSVTTDNDGYKVFLGGNYGTNVVDIYKPSEKKATLNTTNQMVLPSNKGDVFTVTKVGGVSKAVASLLIAPNDPNNYGSYLGTYMQESINTTGADSTFTTSNVKYFNITINDGSTTTSGVTTSGDTYNVVNSYYGHNAHNGATVKVVQYDSNGNVLNVSSLQIAAPHDAE